MLLQMLNLGHHLETIWKTLYVLFLISYITDFNYEGDCCPNHFLNSSTD